MNEKTNKRWTKGEDDHADEVITSTEDGIISSKSVNGVKFSYKRTDAVGGVAARLYRDKRKRMEACVCKWSEFKRVTHEQIRYTTYSRKLSKLTKV